MTARLAKIEYKDTITLELCRCPVCAVPYGVESRMLENRHEHGGSWYCPNGHSIHFTDETVSEKNKRLEQQLAYTEESKDWWKREAEEKARSLSATRGVLTRTKNRIAKGVCPCCHRQFINLRRHMESKHPEYTSEDPKEDPREDPES